MAAGVRLGASHGTVVALGAIMLSAIAAVPAKFYLEDRVQIDNAESGADPVLVYDGRIGDACRRAVVKEAVKSEVVLGDVGIDGNCPTRVAIFSRGHRAWIHQRPWGVTGTLDEVLVARMRDPVIVSVAVRLVMPSGLGAAQQQEHRDFLAAAIAEAEEALYTYRSGIVLKFDPVVEMTATDAEPLFGTGCRGALTARTTVGAHYSHYRINVYVVEDIEATSHVGVTCLFRRTSTESKSEDPGRHDFHAQNIIYLDLGAYRFGTLAHEIGHALGLYAPEPTSGHTDDLGGVFGTNNLMYSIVEDVGHVSLGQSWRINFDLRSFLFRRLRAPLFLSPYRACASDPEDDWPCPPLGLDP